MPEKEEVTDLSRLRISRQEERAPAGKKGRAYLWLAGLLAFLIWIGALGFFLRDRLWGAVGAFLSTPEVTVFQVPRQASPGPARLLSANGYIVARKASSLSSRTSGRGQALVQAANFLAKVANFLATSPQRQENQGLRPSLRGRAVDPPANFLAAGG